MPPHWTPLFLVATGGAIGSAGRYLVGEGVKRGFGDTFPFATLVVNVLGCFAIGVLMAWWGGSGGGVSSGNANLRFFFITGLLGGFTTFSAFGMETHRLFTSGRTELALFNIALSVIVGLAAVGIGVKCGQIAK